MLISLAYARKHACNAPLFSEACDCNCNMHRAPWKKSDPQAWCLRMPLQSLQQGEGRLHWPALYCTQVFMCVYINVYAVYSLQVSCSKLILNTILGAAPFILQCLHIWMYVLYTATTETSTTFPSHHSDVSCKHANTHRIETVIMDTDWSWTNHAPSHPLYVIIIPQTLTYVDTFKHFNLPVANLRDS